MIPFLRRKAETHLSPAEEANAAAVHHECVKANNLRALREHRKIVHANVKQGLACLRRLDAILSREDDQFANDAIEEAFAGIELDEPVEQPVTETVEEAA